MRLRLGYRMAFELPQQTPMIALLNVHYSRTADLERPDHMLTTPSVQIHSYRDGFGNWCNRFVAPAGTFEIADGCSGLRYVITALALVVFYSALFLRRYRSMVILGLFALLGSMLTNWLRITALILIGHFTDMRRGPENFARGDIPARRRPSRGRSGLPAGGQPLLQGLHAGTGPFPDLPHPGRYPAEGQQKVQ